MYYDHFGLDEPPFRITPHTDFFFAGAKRGAMLDALLFALTHDEGIVKVTGEVGSGKTMLCRMLVERLPATVDTIYVANPLLSRDDVVFAIAEELGLRLPEARAIATMQALQEGLIERYAAGRRAVLLIDEAHAVPAQTLEEIRLLSNLESQRHKLLQIVLFGQPELDATLAQPNMRQLKDRITQHFDLEPLRPGDVAAYLEFRMRAAGYRGPPVFEPPATRRIARAAAGLTRRINIVADKALLAAFANGRHQVGTLEARAAIRDARIAPRSSRLAQSAGLTAVLLGLLGIGFAVARYPSLAVRGSEAAAQSVPAPAAPSPATSMPENASPQSSPSGPAPPATLAAQAAAPPAAAGAMPAVPPGTDGLGPRTREHLFRLEPWLANARDEHWFIQLATGGAGSDIERFVAHAASLVDPGALRVYQASVDGRRRLGVIYGEFPSRDEAAAALQSLPASLAATGAYPRQVGKLR